MKTRLDFEAPSDLSLGRVRISNASGPIADWIATPDKRGFSSPNLEPGFYAAEIEPVGVRPRSVIFEVAAGIANTVMMPSFSALFANGGAISFLGVTDAKAAVEAIYGKSSTAFSGNHERPEAAAATEGQPDIPERETVEAVASAPPTQPPITPRSLRLAVGLAQEGPRGRESWDIFPGRASAELAGGRLVIEVSETETWQIAEGRRVRLSVALEQVRIERLMLPLFRGGTQIGLNPVPLTTDDIELKVLPAAAHLRAIWRALEAGTAEEARTLEQRGVLQVQGGRPLATLKGADPWEAMMAGLLFLRFPELFGAIDHDWADELSNRFAWASDVHVIRARQLLLASSKDPEDRRDRAMAAIDLLAHAQSRGSPYFSMANRLLGEMIEGLGSLDVLPENYEAKARKTRERWLRELPLQADHGVTFSWLSRDPKTLKEEGLLVPFRNPRGTLGSRDTAIIFNGQLVDGQITLGALGGETTKEKSSKASSLKTLPTEMPQGSSVSTSPPCPALDRHAGPADDPNKGRFGELCLRDGFRLDARFSQADKSKWVSITLEVEAIGDTVPAVGDFAWFCLHPSFDPQWMSVLFRGRRATLTIQAWGGFTVGVWLPSQRVELESDLALLPNAPAAIRDL